MKKIPLLIFAILLVFAKSVQAQPDSSHMRISLLTCAPGDELYSTFGHTALRIFDSSKQTDIIYNYGTFDFDDPDFYLKFTRGKLDYFLSTESLQQFLYEYLVEKRDVTEQELALNSNAKTVIAKVLSDNMVGANRYYKYDFLYNNCTTRIRDILIKYAGLQVSAPLVIKNTSFRNMLHQYLDKGGEPWSKLGIDLLLGSPIDKKVTIEQSMFLPDYLMNGIDSAAKNPATSILKNKTLLNKGTPLLPGNNYIPLFIFSFFSLVIILLSFVKNKAVAIFLNVVDFSLLLFTGLLGCLLLFMWFGTDHKSCAANYNLLWAIPFNSLAAFFFRKKSVLVKKYFSITAAIYALTLINWLWLPQQLNIALIPLILLLLFRSVQLRKS